MSESDKGGRHWPWIIVGLLVVNGAASGALIAIANASSSHAVEPDYYAKAVAWDDEMAQQRENRRLGWQLLSTVSSTDDGTVAANVVVIGRDGAPITGAEVALETFHLAHASDRRQLAFHELEPGVYGATWPSRHLGTWELRFRVTRGDELFTARQLGEAWR